MSFLARMMRRWLRTSIGAGVLVWLLFLPGPSFALHRQTPFIEPIPFPAINGVNSLRPFCQGEAARWIAFDSTSDLLANGSGGGEVFVWDNDPPAPATWSRSPTARPAAAQDPPTVADGKTVVFDIHERSARPALAPVHRAAPAPADLARDQQVQGQIGYEQLTNDLNGDCRTRVISADGFKIVFECTGDMRRNGSSGTHIFLWRERNRSAIRCRSRRAATPSRSRRTATGISGNA